ncbi:MAG: response regulator, partial [Cytophagales bacterium]|nr:response regulator [Cytophagales bacterium]
MKRKIKISIIEDDEFFAELLYWKLGQNKQYEVTVFNDPDTFLNTPAKSHDVAVIDYHLGNSHYNGLDIAKRIKNVPKIFISGQNDIVCALNMIKEGAAVDYINK